MSMDNWQKFVREHLGPQGAGGNRKKRRGEKHGRKSKRTAQAVQTRMEQEK